MRLSQRLEEARALPTDVKTRRSMAGKYIGDVVYGGLDGIITTFAVVSGVAGAELGASIILILGIANLLADGFSMGTGDYLSTKSEREYYARERQHQAERIAASPDEERTRLQALYEHNGYTTDDAASMVEIQARNPDRWVNAVMIEDRGMLQEDGNPFYNALATFLAFVVAGLLPLIIYLIGLVTPIQPSVSFAISLFLSGVALFTLGAAKVFVTGMNPIRSGIEMLTVGGFAAFVAYVIGAALKGIGGA